MSIELKNTNDPNGKPFVINMSNAAAAPAQAPATGAAAPAAGKTTVNLESRNLKLNIESFKAKAGESVHFVYNNLDDEKHNLFFMDAGIVSPDVNAGKKLELTW